MSAWQAAAILALLLGNTLLATNLLGLRPTEKQVAARERQGKFAEEERQRQKRIRRLDEEFARSPKAHDDAMRKMWRP